MGKAKVLLLLVSLALFINLAISHPKHDKEDEIDNDYDNHNKHKKHGKHDHHSQDSKEAHKRHQSHRGDKDVNDKDDHLDKDDIGWEYENKTKVDTRRILYSKTTKKGTRPYMVYLQLTKESAKAHKYRGWLCGGVIVDRYYVLTSAACVEDADHFYVVSGTTKFVDSFDYKDNDCVCKHRRKVVWKCIPKNYKFDFHDSIKWSSNDIAIVKVHKPFKFGVCEKGCEFATDVVCFNNVSRDLEKPGTKGIIAGWGSGSNFREGVYRRQKPYTPENAKCLQEAKVCIMDNEQCAKKWSQRFRSIITQYMICTKDVMKRLSDLCDKKYANCTDVERRRYQQQLEGSSEGHQSYEVDLGRHLRDPDDYTARRSASTGGFCENDHGGPLIVKYQNKDRVIGVISACKIDPKTHNCHGPFLYTSVFKNRQFISCSIFKDTEESCRRVFRSGITHEEWSVNWDNVKEDDDRDDRADNDDIDDEKERVDSGENKGDDDKDDSDRDDSKEVLREKQGKEDNKRKDKSKDAKKGDSESESSSSESKEKSKNDKSESSEEKKKEKSRKKKSRSKTEDKKHSSSKKKDKSSKKAKKSKDGSEEPNLRSQDRKELFYESSRDDNVNEPDDDE